MNTIKAFKQRAIIGARVKTTLYYRKGELYIEAKRYEDRTISMVQSDGFALATWSSHYDKFLDSWCFWPTKHQFFPIEENTVEITFAGGKLIYTFL